MLYIQSFTFNPFQENTYIIYNDKNECWFVDPGMYNSNEVSVIESFITEKKLTPKAIINTHTHIDHIFGVTYLIDKYNIPFFIHKLDAPVLQAAPGSAVMFGLSFSQLPEVSLYIDEAKPLMLGDDSINVLLTPGHSPGSISFLYKPNKWLISGDVLFAGSIGRTDLPGGSYEVLMNSIQEHLLTLPDDITVYSGHGPSTTIGIERNTNPFLVEISK